MTARVRALALFLAFTPTVATTVVVSAPRPAFAQQEDPAITAEARKRFLEGVKLFDEKKYELARAAFVQAYALKKHPDVLLNLAQSELLSGRAFDAAGHFKDFLKDPTTSTHPRRGDADKGLAEARTRIGRIQVTVDAPDAEVLLDGKKVGMSPLGEPLDVAPGPHVVEARKGGKAANQGILAPEGKITIANLVIGGGGPVAAVVPPPPSTEPTETEPPPKKEREPKSEPKSEPEAASEPEEPAEGGKRESFFQWAKRSPIAFVGAGLTGVGLGVGAGFYIAGNAADGRASRLTDQIRSTAAADEVLAAKGRSSNPCRTPIEAGKVNYEKACSTLQDTIDARDTDFKWATVGFVTAGVGVATIVVGYFVTAKKTDSAAYDARPRPQIMIAPVLGPQLSGLGAAGTF
jgi:hypothetical protein